MSDFDSFDEGEMSKMCQKALYVAPMSRAVDLDTIPTDGHEFILKSKLEDSSLKFPSFSHSSPPKPKSLDEKLLNGVIKKWVRTRFFPFTLEIKSNRNMLQQTYKHSIDFPLHDEKECCSFCLGSEICSTIYKDNAASPPSKYHLPLLRYVIHLRQPDIVELLTLIYKWFKSIGMTNNLCMWMFASFACLHKPLSDDEDDLLEDIYDDCLESLKVSKDDEFIRLQLICSLLKQHFCIKSYAIGPSLWPLEC